jgi:hypothetical protein
VLKRGLRDLRDVPHLGLDLVIPGRGVSRSPGRLGSADTGHQERREQDPLTRRPCPLERLATHGQGAIRLPALERDLRETPERGQDQIDRLALFT